MKKFISIVCGALVCLPAFGADIGSIVKNMAPGSWYEIPDSQISSVFPNKEGHPAWGVEGPTSVTNDWGGAAFDTKRNVLIITGGGHTAYGGNEVYEFSLDSQKWSRVTEPSPMVPDSKDPYYSTTDGTPLSRHTYDGLEYVPSLDVMLEFGGSTYKSGNPTDPYMWEFSPATNKWTQKAKASVSVLTTASAWDSKKNRLLVIGKTNATAYDPARDAWSTVANGWFYQVDRVAAYSPDQNILFMIGSTANKKPIAYLDLDDNKLKSPALTGATDIPLYRPGLAYDPSIKKFVVWGGNSKTWTIDPATWEVVSNDNGPGPVVTKSNATKGIYSKWQYVPTYDIFIAYNSASDNVWLYKVNDPCPATEPPPVDTTPPPVETKTECGADLCVGPDYQLKLPSQAAKVAKEGDSVYIEAGTYKDCTTWPVSVSIRGINGRPTIGDAVCDNKATWITQGKKTTIENVKLEGALGGTSNAASIRHEGKALIVRNVEIYNSHNGILVGHDPEMSVEVYDSVFHGMNTRGDLAHNIYVGKIGRLIVEGNAFYDGQSGHFIKTLAEHSTIAYNRIIQKKDLDAALIDIWGCSKFEIVGNAMMRPGRYGTLDFIQVTPRISEGKTIACPDTRVKEGLIAYNTAFFNNDLHDDSRWSHLVHYNWPMPNLRVIDNVVVHANGIVWDDKGYGFTKNGGVSEGNYFTKTWDDTLFKDAENGDLRLTRDLGQTAIPIEDFVPTKEAILPTGVKTRVDSATPGAFGQ